MKRLDQGFKRRHILPSGFQLVVDVLEVFAKFGEKVLDCCTTVRGGDGSFLHVVFALGGSKTILDSVDKAAALF